MPRAAQRARAQREVTVRRNKCMTHALPAKRHRKRAPGNRIGLGSSDRVWEDRLTPARMRYRDSLPQLRADRPFITDGGL